jgi:hypothetical protein
MNKQFMAYADDFGWKFYEGTGQDAILIPSVGSTWQDILNAVADRGLTQVMKPSARLVVFTAA